MRLLLLVDLPAGHLLVLNRDFLMLLLQVGRR